MKAFKQKAKCKRGPEREFIHYRKLFKYKIVQKYNCSSTELSKFRRDAKLYHASQPSWKTFKLCCVVLMDSCLKIMDMIYWERGHPGDIHDLTSAYGIDVAQQYFLTRLTPARLYL